MTGELAMAQVIGVSARKGHGLGKTPQKGIELLAGLGVRGDAHLGETVQHLHDKKRDPTQPNLRQVHLIHAELFDEAAGWGYQVAPGQLGENITTRGLDLLALPQGALLAFPSGAVVRITGLRNPCRYINALGDGLMQKLLATRDDGSVTPLCGVMGVVETGGIIQPGEGIVVTLPDGPHRPLEKV